MNTTQRKVPSPLLPFNGGELIPEALKVQKRWAPWVTRWLPKARGGKGKWDKRPGLGKSTGEPNTWLTFEAALAEFQRHPGKYAGLGFVLTGESGFIGIDLDNCVTDGAVEPWAREVAQQLASYTEISPSGTGLRIMVEGSIPVDWNNHDVGIEVYGGNTSRFVTITGRHLAGMPADVRGAPSGVLETLADQYARERTKADVVDINMPEIIVDLLLPSIESLDLPYKAKDFLLEGTFAGPDRSETLFATAVALCAAGLDDAEVFSILVHNEHSMGLALEKRGYDYDKALAYLWREDVCKGRIKANKSRPVTTDEFDDVTPPTDAGNPVSTPATGKVRFKVQSITEFAQSPPLTWLIKGIIPKAELCIIYGAPGSGKSFFALDLVTSIARGVEWRGRRVKKGRVVYLAAEGARGFKNRIDAYARHHGIEQADLDAHIGVISDAPNLTDKADIKALVAQIQAFGQTDVIVIDTLARSFQGNENDGEDIGRALAHCKAIHQATGALIILIHHSGKNAQAGARGHSSLKGAVDTQIEIVRSGDSRAAVMDKQKDGSGEGEEFGFSLQTIAIGIDEDGEDITSCVVEHTLSTTQLRRGSEPKGKNERFILAYIKSEIEAGATAVRVDDIYTALTSQMEQPESGKKDRRREYAMKALERLQITNHVVVEKCMASLP